MRRFSNLLALVLLASPLLAQSPVAAPAAAPAAGGAQATGLNPTRPETQPPLNVDRDPVLSPDAADNEAVSAAHPGAGPAARDVERNGRGYTLRRDVEEVVLNATVLDDHNQLVSDLTKDDFHIFEDGVPQTVNSFEHEDIPVSMGILVDNSGSMREKRMAVNSAALDLVQASNRQDEAFIVNFSDEAFIDQDFTSDIGKLREGLSHLDSKGGTALYDATVASADQLAKGARRPKQVLLIITDGEDNASGLSLEQTIKRVQELQGPIIYTIGLLFGDDGGGREGRRAKRALQLLAQETGGIAYFPRSLKDVDAIAAEVARDIRSQYSIGYHSTKPASLGGYRVVKVEVHEPNNRRKLIVRTRTGYYPRTDRSGPTSQALGGSQ